MAIVERPFTMQEAYQADEAFLTSASQFVMPEFLATKARLEELIYSGRSDDDSEYPAVPLLTEVENTVE
jgi:hypothetical protein